jgi:hypothetical protein
MTIYYRFGLLPIMFSLIVVGAHAEQVQQWQAVCTDGDGVLTAWTTYDEANEAGKDHERRTKGHRWTLDSREKPF